MRGKRFTLYVFVAFALIVVIKVGQAPPICASSDESWTVESQADWLNTENISENTQINVENLELGLAFTPDNFRANSGIGTANDTAYFNDGDPDYYTDFDTVGSYVQVNFTSSFPIDAYRFYGWSSSQNLDGEFKLQYLKNGVWENHVENIPTRIDWSDWTRFPPVITENIRVVATTIDTGGALANRVGEWEMRGTHLSGSWISDWHDWGWVPAWYENIQLNACVYNGLTIVDFQTNSGTGTADYPHLLNDGSTTTEADFDLVGDYVQINFSRQFKISEFRYFGYASHYGTGTYKIQYWDGTSWIDLNTDIPTRGASWSDWTPLTIPVITDRIRWVATAIDSYGASRPAEVEMRGPGQELKVKVQVSDDGATVKDETAWTNIGSTGVTTIDLKNLTSGQYSRVLLNLGRDNSEFSPQVQSYTMSVRKPIKVISVSVDNNLIDRNIDESGSGAVGATKVTIRVINYNGRLATIPLRLSIRDNTDTVVVDNIEVAENTIVDENTLDFTYIYTPSSLSDSALGAFDVRAEARDNVGAVDVSDFSEYGYELFEVDDLSVSLAVTDNTPIYQIGASGSISRISGTGASIDNVVAQDNNEGAIVLSSSGTTYADNYGLVSPTRLRRGTKDSSTSGPGTTRLTG